MSVATGRARPANVAEISSHMVLGDRVSERTVDQFRSAGQHQGFVDISGRRLGAATCASENITSSYLQRYAGATTT